MSRETDRCHECRNSPTGICWGHLVAAEDRAEERAQARYDRTGSR